MTVDILWIKNAHIIDPANKRDGVGDLYAIDGKIVDSLSHDQKEHALTLDAQGLIACPGLVDIHVHFREPGQTHKESIATGSHAAAAGGVTTVVCMPNTSPALDNPGTVNQLLQSAKIQSSVNVFTTGTLTVGRKGEEIAPLAALKKAGVVAVTDDGDCIQSNELMRRVAEYAVMYNLPIMDHCQDESLTQGAVMHEGEVSYKLGLTGWPRAAEDIIVARNIVISQTTGAHIHMQHLTSGTAVELIRHAKKQGIRVTAEVSPHHMALTHEGLLTYDSSFKMNPPLREEFDRKALIEGLLDGTIDIIATDHAPHADFEKDQELDKAPFGIIGLETLLPISLEVLYHSGNADLNFVISRLTHKPAELLGLKKGTLSVGADADITIFDPNERWTYHDYDVRSKSKNSPWLNQSLIGRVRKTIVSGHLVYDHN